MSGIRRQNFRAGILQTIAYSRLARHETPGFRHPDQIRIVGIHEDKLVRLLCTIPTFPPSSGNEIIQFPFGGLNPLKRTETEQMRPPHIGNESEIRLTYIHQFLNVSGVARSHFDNRDFCP